MPFINPTDKSASDLYEDRDGSRIDLSDNERFDNLLDRRKECVRAIQALKSAEDERKQIDQEIISMLGNAQSAIASDGSIVSARLMQVKERVMPSFSYVRIFISHKRRADWRTLLKG